MVETTSLGRGTLGVLWGKSDAGGHPNLLLQHLLDTAAVGELIWERFLATSVQREWDQATDGSGCAVFMAMCGLHDVGKATPAFQSKVPDLAAPVHAAGLTWQRLNAQERDWHHTLAGARIVREVLPSFGWTADSVRWVWPFIAGHHGKVPSAGRLTPPGLGACHGAGVAWRHAQAELVAVVGAELGLQWAQLATVRPPSRAAQLALLGSLVMADWVASNDQYFTGVLDPDSITLSSARARAAAAWAALGLRGGWASSDLPSFADPVAARFGVAARPGQALIVAEAQAIPAPGLMLVEAPMGEGKTEAALAAVEVLARRFGADGVFVGMPTQATSDPMFGRVRRWATEVDPTVPLALLHGKSRFNRDWQELLARGKVQIRGVDEFDCDDPYRATSPGGAASTGNDQAPAEWLLGRKRGLLTPIVVGTVDQLLFAATRTRHVMLRHAGLAGKVVVLDEVHAYDVYMAQFLHEALRWLGEARVPVIALSATLPPQTRQELALAYLQGATGIRDLDVAGLPSPEGYPSCTWATAVAGTAVFGSGAANSWRPPLPVKVTLLDEPVDTSAAPLVDLLKERLAGGGCALVVRNTVGRAQLAYQEVKAVFGSDTVLLHARLTAGERADRTDRVLDLLGPPTADRRRPRRLVVVATQLAEQSFDVDADLLITDLAPIDLLLQRAGRLHRHTRPAGDRPRALREPEIVVTGVRGGRAEAPAFPRGSTYVYGRHLLLRAAGLVFEAAREARGWSIPDEVPELVRRGYEGMADVPSNWHDAVEEAAADQAVEEASRRAAAELFLLSGPDDLGAPTLAGLHDRRVGDPTQLDDEDAVMAVVRDGDPSIEVVLVRQDERGYLTLDGRPLGATGEAVSDRDVLERVVRDTVRLRPEVTEVALEQLSPLPGWTGDPWLGRTRALVLDASGSAQLGGWEISYDQELGLTGRRTGRKEG